MTASVPICVIGGGSIGVRHIQCAVASDTVALSAVVEPSARVRAELAAMGLPAVADLDAVPPQTRAAIVATPTPSHAQVAMGCLDRGWGVLVEKPLTSTVEDADRLIAHARVLGLALVTGHHRRCHPFVACAKAMMSDLGDLVALQGIWALRKHDSYFEADWRREPGAGVILTNLSHEIDLLQYLAGPIVAVSAMTSCASRRLAVEDTAAVSLRFQSGATGTFLISDAGASPWAFEAATAENPAIAVRGDDPLRLIGTTGALSCPSLTHWKGDGGSDWQYPMAVQPGPTLETCDPIAIQLERFAALVQGHQDELLATGAEGLRTICVLDAIQRSSQTGTVQQVTV